MSGNSSRNEESFKLRDRVRRKPQNGRSSYKATIIMKPAEILEDTGFHTFFFYGHAVPKDMDVPQGESRLNYHFVVDDLSVRFRATGYFSFHFDIVSFIECCEDLYKTDGSETAYIGTYEISANTGDDIEQHEMI